MRVRLRATKNFNTNSEEEPWQRSNAFVNRWKARWTLNICASAKRPAGALAGVEWEREAGTAATPPEREPQAEEPPFGVRVGGDCEHLEENPQEMQFLLSMMELIIQDISLTKVAEELRARATAPAKEPIGARSLSSTCSRD